MIYPTGKEIHFKMSKKSPILKGVIVKDTGLNRIWVKATKDRHGKFLKARQKNIVATSRNLIFM